MARKFPQVKPVSASVQLLEKQLSSADPDVRKAGLLSIPKLSAPTDQILDCADRVIVSENWFARRAAADALAFSVLHHASKSAMQAVELGAKHLASEDPEVRRCAGMALVAIAAQPKEPPKELLPGEVPKEPTDLDTETADNLSISAANVVAQCLHHEDAGVRETAVNTFAGLDKWATPHASDLAKLVGDGSHLTRRAAIRAVDKLGAVVSTASEDMAVWFEHQEAMIRNCAKDALVALSNHDGLAAGKGAVTALRSPDPLARKVAMQCFLEMQGHAAPHGQAIAAMLEDADFIVRALVPRVFEAAAKENGKEVAKSLKYVVRRMDHAREDVRRVATDTARAVAPLVEKFARSQGRLFVEDMVGVDPEIYIQKKLRAMQVLGGAGENVKPYLEYIVAELESKDWRLRREAVHCMEDLGEHAVGYGVKEVSRRLLHEEPDVRRAAVEAMGRMGIHTGGYSDRVESLLDTEEDPDVRKACEIAVERLRVSGAFDIARRNLVA